VNNAKGLGTAPDKHLMQTNKRVVTCKHCVFEIENCLGVYTYRMLKGGKER